MGPRTCRGARDKAALCRLFPVRGAARHTQLTPRIYAPGYTGLSSVGRRGVRRRRHHTCAGARSSSSSSRRLVEEDSSAFVICSHAVVAWLSLSGHIFCSALPCRCLLRSSRSIASATCPRHTRGRSGSPPHHPPLLLASAPLPPAVCPRVPPGVPLLPRDAIHKASARRTPPRASRTPFLKFPSSLFCAASGSWPAALVVAAGHSLIPPSPPAPSQGGRAVHPLRLQRSLHLPLPRNHHRRLPPVRGRSRASERNKHPHPPTSLPVEFRSAVPAESASRTHHAASACIHRCGLESPAGPALGGSLHALHPLLTLPAPPTPY